MEDPEPALTLFLLNIQSAPFFVGFTWSAIWAIVSILFLLIFSALVSGSETAFFSLKPVDLEKLRQSIHPNDKLVLQLGHKPKELLATMLIANNFINVSIVILSTFIVSQLFDIEANPTLTFILQVVVITSIILIFGEIIPKMLANKEPYKVALFMARPMKVLETVFKPLSSLLVMSTSVIDRKIAKTGHNITRSELSDAIQITVDESALEDEKMILKGIASFANKEASEIMQSRVNVTALDHELSFDEVMKVVLESGYSRIPVYEETLDKVLGVLYIKDLLPFGDTEIQVTWQNLIRPSFFVPENKKINDLLQEFREKKIHLAIVVDEYGGTSGIITLEDIIEEIVGEISDEFDKELLQFKFKKLSETSFLFEAKTPLNDICKILRLSDDVFDEVRGESDSLGGLILELEEKIPDRGASVSYKQFEFIITDVDQRRIKEVKVILKPEIVKKNYRG